MTLKEILEHPLTQDKIELCLGIHEFICNPKNRMAAKIRAYQKLREATGEATGFVGTVDKNTVNDYIEQVRKARGAQVFFGAKTKGRQTRRK